MIDPVTMAALTTVPLGKRPRGIHAGADGKLIFVALSGSPSAPPGVDESTLPPPDRSADGISIAECGAKQAVAYHGARAKTNRCKPRAGMAGWCGLE